MAIFVYPFSSAVFVLACACNWDRVRVLTRARDVHFIKFGVVRFTLAPRGPRQPVEWDGAIMLW